MAYVCEINTGYRVYLDNTGTQTIITTSMSLPGQQQQSSSSVETGAWVSPPEAYQTATGAIFKIITAQGDRFIQVQGSSMAMVSGTPRLSGAQQMQVQQAATPILAMQPMQPMQPMKMGNMQMDMNPMEMRMGNMEMRMGTASSTASSAASRQVQRFCSQCGTQVNLGDRFCSACGQALSDSDSHPG